MLLKASVSEYVNVYGYAHTYWRYLEGISFCDDRSDSSRIINRNLKKTRLPFFIDFILIKLRSDNYGECFKKILKFQFKKNLAFSNFHIMGFFGLT